MGKPRWSIIANNLALLQPSSIEHPLSNNDSQMQLNLSFQLGQSASANNGTLAANNQLPGTGYDAAGNQLLVNGNTVGYDAENHQVSVTAPASTGGGVETYQFDGLGQRAAKSGPGGVVVYVYDGLGQLVAEYSSAIATASPCQTCYLSTDHLGNLRLVTDQTGKVLSRHDYLPYGEETTVGRTADWNSNDGLSQKFTGQMRDSETGEDYFNARMFGSALGRFTSPDPGNAGADLYHPQSWNGYAYVNGNPLNSTDPTGLCASTDTPPCYSGGTTAFSAPDFATSFSLYWSSFPYPFLNGMFNNSGGPRSQPNQPSSGGGGQPSPPPGTPVSNPLANNGTRNNDIVVTATKKARQLLQCTADHFGLTALGSGLAAAGANVLGTGGKFSGATPGTSLASKTAGSLLGDLKLPFRLPTLTGFPGIGNGLRITFTESAARFAGRAVPVVGYALLAYAAYEIGTCTVNGGE